MCYPRVCALVFRVLGLGFRVYPKGPCAQLVDGQFSKLGVVLVIRGPYHFGDVKRSPV